MSEAKPAATLILLRNSDAGFELFMVERARSMSFAGGAMVFPGGKVDGQDMAVADDPELAPGFATLDRSDALARVAAIRETFEEAGVLMTDGPPIGRDARAQWRARLARHESDFATFLRTVGHRLEADRLIPFANWVPPENVSHRFDTIFYLAVMPDDQSADHDGHETTRSHWITPQEAIRLADEGLHAIIFPTRRNLERIALHDVLEALLETARSTPLRRIQPFIEQRNGRAWLCIPEGYGYPVTAEPADGLRRE